MLGKVRGLGTQERAVARSQADLIALSREITIYGR